MRHSIIPNPGSAQSVNQLLLVFEACSACTRLESYRSLPATGDTRTRCCVHRARKQGLRRCPLRAQPPQDARGCAFLTAQMRRTTHRGSAALTRVDTTHRGLNVDDQSCCQSVGRAHRAETTTGWGSMLKQKQQVQATCRLCSRACAPSSRSLRVCDTPRHPRDVLKIHAHAGANSTDKLRRVSRSAATAGSPTTSMRRVNTSVMSQGSRPKS